MADDEGPIDFDEHRRHRKGKDWKAQLITSASTGAPKPLLANAIAALRQAPDWRNRIAYDEFCRKVEIVGQMPWPIAPPIGAEWTDHYDSLTAEWLQYSGIHVSADIAGKAVHVVARENGFHPVRDYLDRLSWDGTHRLDSWPQRYLGCIQSPYTEAVGAKWAMSAVARIYQPGAKADCCIILEGKQNIGKSTALRRLGEPWFTDEVAELGTKDSEMQLIGAWILELSELDSMSRGEIARVKAFMSRSTDRFRPPYGRHVISAPRQCVFAGTVNHNDYLRDETGGRRFWPLECGIIDSEGLGDVRDALWAEARDRYRAGEAWWLEDAGVIGEAEAVQADRYQDDPWQQPISDYLAARLDYERGISIPELLKDPIGRDRKDHTQTDMNRVARILKSLKWDRFKARTGTNREWRYRPIYMNRDQT